jgi:hypothetical protein
MSLAGWVATIFNGLGLARMHVHRHSPQKYLRYNAHLVALLLQRIEYSRTLSQRQIKSYSCARTCFRADLQCCTYPLSSLFHP